MKVEFRIPLPLHVDEFQIGQLFMVYKMAVLESSKGKSTGVKVLKNQPFDNTAGNLMSATITDERMQLPVPRVKGQYTLKQYMLGDNLPSFLNALLPAGTSMLVEEAWNAYPHCYTILTNGYLSTATFHIIVESHHLSGPPSDLASPFHVTGSEVRVVDIASDKYTGSPGFVVTASPQDVTSFVSAKTGRGPLAAGWYRDSRAPSNGEGGGGAVMMTCYKHVTALFKYFPLQGTTESFIVNNQEKLFAESLSQCFLTLDEWGDLSLDDIRELEATAMESDSEGHKTQN